ncbi:hypothetical protein GCM10011396_50130 [Undibacterium terreum]|uniref:Uncharacterized protein n=1 Tax=Undibacterium terreum TaxID=1224302 RepID=A0A916UZH0_9BURK|nr:hypothetical protein GCM10011396_50130 [Undibacterium terreum]
MWQSMSLDFNRPYYLLGYAAGDESPQLGHTFLFWELDRLVHYCREVLSDDAKRLTQVSMICPNWMTKSAGWQMVDISEIRQVKVKRGNVPIFVYVAKDGRELSDSRSNLHLKKTGPHESILTVEV